MKEIYSKIILILSDVFIISVSIFLAYIIRKYIGGNFDHPFKLYIFYPYIYIFVILLFFYEGIYFKRLDFWHETKLILKSLVLAFLLLFALLALTKKIDNFSRVVLVFTFVYMAVLIPLFKIAVKYILYKTGIWRRKAKIIGNIDDKFKREIENFYLGYEITDKNAKNVFVKSDNDYSKLKKLIDEENLKHHEVIFIPILNDYNLSESFIYELFDSRTNLIVLQNKLKSKLRMGIKTFFDYLISIFIFPFVLILLLIIGILIKLESKGPVFFKHKRVGKDGKIIEVYKFRTMYSNSQEILNELLKDPKIKEEWERTFKLKDDPRITKIGKFLRKTSLDELPQIFNVLKGEMSLVGPRPVIQKEIDEYYKDDKIYYYMVKPGITGLWQVSGRSDVEDYKQRVEMDKWYVKNWSLWLDFVILLKTVKIVLLRKGAY